MCCTVLKTMPGDGRYAMHHAGDVIEQSQISDASEME